MRFSPESDQGRSFNPFVHPDSAPEVASLLGFAAPLSRGRWRPFPSRLPKGLGNERAPFRRELDQSSARSE